MDKPSTDYFYNNLSTHVMPLQDVLRNKEGFEKVPDDWSIIVTDVEGSTAIFEKGDQQLVHLASTGSIIACLNIARDLEIEIPFFFGGDGATILVPPSITAACIHALTLHQERCRINFEFHLRVGFRTVGTLATDGSFVRILKYKRNEFHTMPVILGNALKLAEKQIKENDTLQEEAQALEYNLNLTGMECKWDKIAPPVPEGEVLSLIINAVNNEDQHKIYSKIIQLMEDIYGNDGSRNPISATTLKIIHNVQQLRNEVSMKFKTFSWFNWFKSFVRTCVATVFIRFTPSGKKYLDEIVNLTEILMLDGSINTVIAGTKKQRLALLKTLNLLEEKGIINYGYYVSKSSVISCYVTAVDSYHIHFLDGDNGGYTRASKVLKAKLSS